MIRARLVISNDFSELGRVTAWLREACSGGSLGQELLDSLDLCANELVTNIISYAYDDDRRHDIVLQLNETPGGAQLVVSDDGRPFNILDVPAHRQPGSLAEARIGGLGVHLVRQLSTGCSYRRDDGRNIVAVDLPRYARARNA